MSRHELLRYFAIAIAILVVAPQCKELERSGLGHPIREGALVMPSPAPSLEWKPDAKFLKTEAAWNEWDKRCRPKYEPPCQHEEPKRPAYPVLVLTEESDERLSFEDLLNWWWRRPVYRSMTNAKELFEETSIAIGVPDKPGRATDASSEQAAILLIYSRPQTNPHTSASVLDSGGFSLLAAYGPAERLRSPPGSVSVSLFDRRAMMHYYLYRTNRGRSFSDEKANGRAIFWDEPATGGAVRWIFRTSKTYYTDDQALELARRTYVAVVSP